MKFILIILICIASAIIYGISHDMVTAHVCVEYFSIGHPRVIRSQSPIALALVWGVISTWWVGLPLGVLIARAARVGSRPKLEPRDIIKPIAMLLAVMAICSAFAGVIGWLAASSGWRAVPGVLDRIPPEAHARFLADLCAHNAAYVVGAVGAVVLAIWLWRRRGKMVSMAAELRVLASTASAPDQVVQDQPDQR
ncbi:MAG: hypothetical protein IT435_05135 [Phycisphaerales bacterium]|nr:hypothetical protein [Phycisphaerales bacterium]